MMPIVKNPLKTKLTEWKGMPIVSLPVHELWTSVREVDKFQRLLLEDLPKNGLVNPILVVDATFAELFNQKKRYGMAMLEPPTGFRPHDKIYVVWGGTQRVNAAKKLGYTHVDCVIYNNDFAAAFKDQALHRKDYNHWYNGRVK